MEHNQAPAIEVGIVRSATIRFRLKGTFHLTGADPSAEKTAEGKGAGIAIESGSYEAVESDGTITVVQENRTLFSGRRLWMEPADPGLDRFLLHEVVIGVGFHWEQKEDQEFPGTLKLMAADGRVQVVNVVPLEEYLVSVISSEMRGDSSPELLKAHTIISRSWLLAQVEKQHEIASAKKVYETIHREEGEFIRWYDREDHAGFHVCADDHCQRYQGITRAYNPQVEQAVRETGGQVLVYDGKICDARFSKCCGGVTETFESCWEPVPHPYLRRVDDNPGSTPVNVDDLTIESNAIRFIGDTPEAFCNTSDPMLLRQVLNDYDQDSSDFYRWEVTYSQEEISGLIREKSGMDFGRILDLIPVERGVSARLVRLRIVGEKQTLVVGKELEIRRLLSKSHLYSSAFIVEKGELTDRVPGSFTLRGAGWGHGVGLCQIGAAVMADRGYGHREILEHYFVGANIEKRYE
jgi:SpoIID/LytB domain protein